ncbi:MAG: hypothetical protein M3R20_05245 [Pseudomonadota bacterium]|nr:hypothetical protein [Pseudomonadota bacterium]
MDARNRQRLQLLLVASIFALPILVAMALTLAGWMPGTKSYGVPILPQRSVAKIPLTFANGAPFAWRDRGFHWTLIALPGAVCREHCLRALDMIHRVRITLNQSADKLRLVYLGTPSNDAQARSIMQPWRVAQTVAHDLDDLRPARRDALAAVLVMPDGVALTLYPDGFDANGLKKDLHKVIK